MDTTPRLREQACFALYTASRAVIGLYRPMLDRLGLTYPQFLVLMALWETDGLTVTALGDALQLDSGTVSPLLKRLEAAGFVERRRESGDERRVTVHLTEAGAALESRGCEITRVVGGAAGMSPEELTALRDRLNAFTESVRSTRAAE
ncbi:MarR family transcriptional regulator [Glycomyces sp. TRM65418]|uniref:MarR family winged helix-turn-helix transcriptional regulator n=1 Tax=Glycomyces sp. TRM65418 TaxID=2867006 RepID=UPI001CE5EE90|nr:MarR family transcriptional regulator [Glycomyces sp. TRM65418]MCC3762966.1 MarR family transcriptional regulator [Glycomyces sp. TRM65418]QZD56986.1 MarR family transcriptional regulator [Glycomyces sp. TRM65418]